MPRGRATPLGPADHPGMTGGSTAATFAPLYAEQNPNIGTLLEHTGLEHTGSLAGRVPVTHARFTYFVRKKW